MRKIITINSFFRVTGFSKVWRRYNISKTTQKIINNSDMKITPGYTPVFTVIIPAFVVITEAKIIDMIHKMVDLICPATIRLAPSIIGDKNIIAEKSKP